MDKILEEHKEMFGNDLGAVKGLKAKLRINEKAVPKLDLCCMQ